MSHIYTPYTYLIGWSKYDKWYYGVRYQQGCHPSDLWQSYFTSSKHVKRFQNKHGDPDIIQIRKTFDCRNRALLWERNVLFRMNVKNDGRFLNASHNMAPFPSKFDRAKNFEPYIESLRGKTYEEIYGKKKGQQLRQERKENFDKYRGYTKGLKWSDKSKKKLSESIKGHSRLKGYSWYNNGKIERMFPPNTTFPDSSWVKGRLG